jgi:hypothetical protein
MAISRSLNGHLVGPNFSMCMFCLRRLDMLTKLSFVIYSFLMRIILLRGHHTPYLNHPVSIATTRAITLHWIFCGYNRWCYVNLVPKSLTYIKILIFIVYFFNLIKKYLFYQIKRLVIFPLKRLLPCIWYQMCKTTCKIPYENFIAQSLIVFEKKGHLYTN